MDGFSPNLRGVLRQSIFEAINKKEGKGKEKRTPGKIRSTCEKRIIFAMFFILYWLTRSNALFSGVDWMLHYVTVISIFWGLHQSLIFIILANGAYLFAEGVNLLEMSNFYFYAGCVLMIAEFIFYGITLIYTLDALVRKRMDSSPERVIKEILNAMAELMEPKTVSVYMAAKNRVYLRLVNFLNKESMMQGKSWNISQMPLLIEAIRRGNQFSGHLEAHFSEFCW